MASETPVSQTLGFKTHSSVPSSSKAFGSVPHSVPGMSSLSASSTRVPYNEGEEYARVLSHERAARKHAEHLADSHAKSARVLEVSKTELVRKLLSMKIEMERAEREKKTRRQDEPSSLEVIDDMKKQIEVTSNELTDSNHLLAEQSRKSAVAAQELVNMNRNLRSMEEELRQTKQKLTEAERSKFDVMLRTSNYEKRVKSREALSENRLLSAEMQSANAQSMLDKLEERIAYLDRRSTFFPSASTEATPVPTATTSASTQQQDPTKRTYLDENNVPPLKTSLSSSSNSSSLKKSNSSSSSRANHNVNMDPDRAAVLRQQVLKNVDIVHDLQNQTKTEASFAIPNMIENDGDLHISEARTVLVDPRKLDPTVGAHMDYLTFKALSSDKFKRNSSDLNKASYIHQRQFASAKKDKLNLDGRGMSPAIDQTVKDTHAAYAQFSKYKKYQDNDNASAAEKKLSALVNENHQLKVSKEKSDLQCKAAVEESEDMREQIRVIRLENEQYRATSNDQEQDLIGWKVKTFEEIANLDTSMRKIVASAQAAIDKKAKDVVLSKLSQTEGKIKKLFSCVEMLSRHYKQDKTLLEEKSTELEAKVRTIEEQEQKLAEITEEHEKHKIEVADSIAAANQMKAEVKTDKSKMKMKFKQSLASLQMSTNQTLDTFQQKLNEISIKASRTFVEADKRTNAFDDLLGERTIDEHLKNVESELAGLEDLNNDFVSSATASLQELSSNYSEVAKEKEKLAEELQAEKTGKSSLEEKAKEAEAKAEASTKELAAVQESFDKLKVESEEQLKAKDEKLENTISEASHLLQEVDELTERIMEKEKDFVAVQEEVQKMEKAKEEAEEKLEKCEISLETKEEELKTVQEKVGSLETMVETKEKELASSKEEVEAEISEVTENYEEAKVKLETISIENQALVQELEITSSKLTEAEASCEEASSLLVELKQNHEKEKKELVDHLEEENKELHDQVSEKSARIEALEEQVKQEQAELESYGDTIAAAEKHAEAAEAQCKESEEKIEQLENELDRIRPEMEEMREQLEKAVAQKQAAEERTATAISKLYDMESRVEYEKKRAGGVVQVVSQQLNMEGRSGTAALISDFARLQQQLEEEVNETKRAELQERLDSLKLAMQYEEANSGNKANSASFMQLENKLQTERDIRKRLEGELKEALDKCVANEEENQMLLKEYEEVVEENKFLVSQIENLSK